MKTSRASLVLGCNMLVLVQHAFSVKAQGMCALACITDDISWQQCDSSMEGVEFAAEDPSFSSAYRHCIASALDIEGLASQEFIQVSRDVGLWK